MIRINDQETQYSLGMTLRELADSFYAPIVKADFNDLVVIVNNTPITGLQAEEMILMDGDTVYLVPKLDGG